MIRKRRWVLALIFASVVTTTSGAQKKPGVGGRPKVVTNSIGVQFVLIPSGSFVMGSERPPCKQYEEYQDKGDYYECMNYIAENEWPRHEVVISRPFYLATCEVTQAQWQAVMGNNPAFFNSVKLNHDASRHPVESVSWDDAQEFIVRLNTQEKTNSYRLPTEAEWEYACRAGNTGRGYGADVINLAWCKADSNETTHQVGTKMPNPWGLYDMLGNVWEWCQDVYDEGYYRSSPERDPKGPPSGSKHVMRGACYVNGAQVRFAARADIGRLYDKCSFTGLRLAKDL